MKTQKLYSLEIIKAIGIILVINSHLDSLYKIPFIGTGGSLGNSLFFLASGIGLGYGWASHGPLPFAVWFKRRLLRIYPSLIILSIIASAFSPALFTQRTFAEGFAYFIYPTQYFFIAAIILFYIPAYFILLFDSVKVIIGALLASVSVYVAWYARLDLDVFTIEGGGFFRWVFYFIVFLIGILYARYKSTPKTFISRNRLLTCLQCFIKSNIYKGLFLSIALVGCAKIIFRLQLPYIMQYQFVIHILTLILACYIFKAADYLSDKIRNSKYAFPVISILSATTLQLYLIDYYTPLYIAPANALIATLSSALPVQFLIRLLAVSLVWCILLASAVLLSKCSQYTVKKLFSS